MLFCWYIRQAEEEFEDITTERMWDVLDRSFIEPVVKNPKSFACTFPLRGSRASAVTSHSLWRPGFNPSLVRKRFLVDKITLGQVSLQYFSLPLSVSNHQCSIHFIHLPSMLYTLNNYLCHCQKKKNSLPFLAVSLCKFYTLSPPTYRVQDINYLWIGKQDCQEGDKSWSSSWQQNTPLANNTQTAVTNGVLHSNKKWS